MTLSDMHMIVLRHIHRNGEVDLREVSEPMRQKIIDLGMNEPPLINVRGDLIACTACGRATVIYGR